MRFSARLLEVKNRLNSVTLLLDVGTDHAYLPIKAVQENICEKAVAIDNKKGPLNIAKDNIGKRGLSDIIFPLLSEGLLNVHMLSQKDFINCAKENELSSENHIDDNLIVLKDDRVFIKSGTLFSISIAGMGGENIIHILSESEDVSHNASEIILEPQKNIDKVIDFFNENSYSILDEKNVFSDGKYYTVFKVKYASD